MDEKKKQHTAKKPEPAGSCDVCMNYSYDEDYECYTCDMDLDEDEMYHFLTNKVHSCPYFKMGNEYQIVKHQM